MDIKIEDIELAVESCHSYPGLQVTPILAKEAKPSSVHRFLWEGIEDKSIEITEQRQSSVPNVTLVNHSTESFLGYKGTIIRGGGQNRHLLHSFVVPKEAKLNVPVQCIQHGRWNPDPSKKFSSKSGDVTSSSVRYSKKTQSETWSTISHTSLASGTSSYTDDYTVTSDYLLGEEQEMATATCSISSTSQAMESERSKSRDRAQKILQDLKEPIANQIGVYVTKIDTMEQKDKKLTIHCIEMFSSPELYAKAHKDIISSFIVDTAVSASENSGIEVPKPDSDSFQKLIGQVKNTPWQENPKIGLEKRYETKTESKIFGESIFLEDEMVHLMYSSQL